MIGVGEQSSVARSVQLASILRAQYSSAKVSLPVNGSVYTRFKHVQGIPSNDAGGYSVNKLRMLDLMVERLMKLRGEPVEAPRPANDAEASDALVELADRIRDALAEVQTPRGSYAAGVIESGMLLNLVA